MDRDINNDSASGLRSRESPALETRGQINRMKDAGRERFPNRSFLDEFPQRAVRYCVAEVMVGPQNDVCSLCRFKHLSGIVHREGQGVLAQNVFAGRPGREPLIAM